MTKKDYELIADVFKKCIRVETEMVEDNSPDSHIIAIKAVKFTAQAMAVKLAQENPQFSKDKFLLACCVND